MLCAVKGKENFVTKVILLKTLLRAEGDKHDIQLLPSISRLNLTFASMQATTASQVQGWGVCANQ